VLVSRVPIELKAAAPLHASAHSDTSLSDHSKSMAYTIAVTIIRASQWPLVACTLVAAALQPRGVGQAIMLAALQHL
jgi:hypothetical protein